MTAHTENEIWKSTIELQVLHVYLYTTLHMLKPLIYIYDMQAIIKHKQIAIYLLLSSNLKEITIYEHYVFLWL